MQPIDPDAIPPETIRPLRRSEYDRLVELGVFGEERIELLYGRLVEMSPQGRGHSYTILTLTELLTLALAGRARVAVQLPLAASDESEPEPDVAVLEPGAYLHDHPRSAYLIIEVADSSRPRDLKLKPQLYAEMGVPDYWVVDLPRRELVVHRAPAAGRYGEVRTHGATAEVALLRFPDVVVSVAAILPPA